SENAARGGPPVRYAAGRIHERGLEQIAIARRFFPSLTVVNRAREQAVNKFTMLSSTSRIPAYQMSAAKGGGRQFCPAVAPTSPRSQNGGDLEFRRETLNLIKRTNFDLPNQQCDGPSFGQINSRIAGRRSRVVAYLPRPRRIRGFQRLERRLHHSRWQPEVKQRSYADRE